MMHCRCNYFVARFGHYDCNCPLDQLVEGDNDNRLLRRIGLHL